MAIVVDRNRLFLLALVASMCQYSAGVCPVTLSNVVLKDGARHRFDIGNQLGPVQWQYCPAGVTFNILKDITNRTGFFNKLLEGFITPDATGLTIPVVSSNLLEGAPYSTVGTYILTFTDTNCTTAAKVIVAKSSLKCECNSVKSLKPSTALLFPGNRNYTCSFAYFELLKNRAYPVITWLNTATQETLFSDKVWPNRTERYTMLVVSTLTQRKLGLRKVLSRDYRLQCQLSISAPERYQIPNVATNQPEYSDFCDHSPVCGSPVIG